MQEKILEAICSGDVILIPTKQIEGQKLSHLTLVEGEVTGHRHHLTRGNAQLYTKSINLYLRVLPDQAVLADEEHYYISVPQGNWVVRI